MSKTVLLIRVLYPFRMALSLAARFGARPTQTRSLLFLMPLRTTLTLLVTNPVNNECNGDLSPIDLKSSLARHRDKSLPFPTAMKAQKVGPLIQTRNVICVLCLIVFAIFETYSALGTALDNSRRFPAWEAKLGSGLFILPSLLMIGLAHLLFGKRLTLGFALVVSSLLLYMGFVLLELALVGKIERTDWVVVGIWATLCAITTAAAWVLRRRSTQP
jgi:hypothetical protein